MRIKLFMPAVLLAAVIAGGCGGGNTSPADTSRDQVSRVIDDLGKFARNGDGARICDELFTTNLRISVARASKTTCAREVGDNLFSPKTHFDVKKIDVNDNSATATVTDQADRTSSLVLFRERGAWQIARIG